MKPTRFTGHARAKFADLTALGLTLSESQVVDVIDHPDRVDEGHHGRQIAQGTLDESHVLRVVFEEADNEIVVVTFYPGRRRRYEGPL